MAFLSASYSNIPSEIASIPCIFPCYRELDQRTVRSRLDPPPDKSRNIVAIKIHHFVPRERKVVYKLLFRVVRRIDFGNCAELGI